MKIQDILICSWLLLEFPFCAVAECIFDDIKLKRTVRSSIDYPDDDPEPLVLHKQYSEAKEEAFIPGLQSEQLEKREVHHQKQYNFKRKKRKAEDLYQPIRIHPEYVSLDVTLYPYQQERLKRVLTRALEKVRRTLSVVPVPGRLLLGRSAGACQVVWSRNSTHSGKCARAHPRYLGETCIDRFQIPNKHLQGLYVYSSTSSTPTEIIKEGEGLADTDFVLYVRSLDRRKCTQGGKGVIAYAAYCQVDQHYRPIAGYINFCPDILRNSSYEEERVYMTALHELLHALGFDHQLFEHFQQCFVQADGRLLCARLDTDTVNTYLSVKRFMSPTVVDVASRHFNCSTHPTQNEFGPILALDKHGAVESHWDAAFMQTSIMTPTIGLPHLTFLDPLTLALFEDTGWYQVQHEEADDFVWGKDEGCEFGLYPSCSEEDDCFCDQKNHVGCHFLHHDKGTCKSGPFLHQCKIYKASPNDNCEMSVNAPDRAVLERHGETYAEGSRCFNGNLTKQAGGLEPSVGRCYRAGCVDGRPRIQVGQAPWCDCPPGLTITVPGFSGVVECPEGGILCGTEAVEPSAEPEPTEETTTTHTTSTARAPDPPETRVLCLDIGFSAADFGLLERHQQLAPFEDACSAAVARLAHVRAGRIQDWLLYAGSVHFRFYLHPPLSSGPTVGAATSMLREVIAAGNFTVTLSSRFTFTATSISSGCLQATTLPSATSSNAAAALPHCPPALLLALAVYIVLVTPGLSLLIGTHVSRLS